MSNPVKPIPEGYHSITPGLVCRDAARAIDFYKKVFGAVEIMRMPGPGGMIMHAELKIGDSVIFVNDEFPEMGAVAPDSSGNRYCSLFLYVEDGCAFAGINSRTISTATVIFPALRCRPIRRCFIWSLRDCDFIPPPTFSENSSRATLQSPGWVWRKTGAAACA